MRYCFRGVFKKCFVFYFVMLLGDFMRKSEYLERLYRIFPWVKDPFTTEGLKRYEKTISEFRVVVTHAWLKKLMSKKKELRLIDLCSGVGIGVLR